MNYKAEIPVYKYEGYLTEQLTVLFDEDLYERLENASIDLGISMNEVVRTLLDHGLKHCNIDADQGDSCKNCKEYVADDMGNYVCCNKDSKFFGSFRPSDAWCIYHKRGKK